MSGVKPFFLTGANAKIKVNGRTLAYCTNLSYSVRVEHATPTVLGMYEASSVEPIGYTVTGQFSVIRYIADVANGVAGKNPNGVRNHGNGIGNWGESGVSIANLADGRAYENLKPSKLHTATTFDLEVIQKTPTGSIAAAKIRDVRITQADFKLEKKSAATQTFNFTALYADEDSFLADFSGTSQKFQ